MELLPFVSTGEPEGCHKILLEFRNNRLEFVVQLSLIGTEKPNECSILFESDSDNMMMLEAAEGARRIQERTEMLGDQGSWVTFVQRITTQFFAKCS